MTLADAALISQIAAAILVAASFIFVGVQIRQNSKSMRMSAYQAAQERLDNVRQMIVENAEVAEIYDLGLKDPTLLDDTQLVRFRLLLFVAASAMQTLHVLFVQTGIDGAEWKRLEATTRRMFASRGGRAWWSLFRHELDPAFARAVDGLIEHAALEEQPSRADWQGANAKGASQ